MANKQPTTRRERRITARKTQILAAAASVFRQKGFERATTREIADAADVSEGTLYNYFGSKRDLLLGVVRTIADETIRDLGDSQFTDIEGTMIQVLAHRFQQAREYRLLTLFLHQARLHPDVYRHYVQEVLDPLKQGLEAYIDALIASGAMRPVNPAIAARTLIGMTMGFSILFELGNDPAIEEASSAELAAVVTDIFLNGLRGKRSAGKEMEARND